MFAKRMTRISALLAVVMVMAVVTLALNTGTSEAQGPGDRGPRGGGGAGAGMGAGTGTQPMDGTGAQNGFGAQNGAGVQGACCLQDGTGAQNQWGGMQARGAGQNFNGVGMLPPASGLPLTDTAIAALEAGLQDEQNAYALYGAVIDQFGAVAPFSRIQAAEAQHMAKLEALFERYDLAIPAAPAISVPTFATLAEACSAAAEVEAANLPLYDQWISQLSDYPDLVTVFTSLRNASEFNHLPAFERCAG